MPIGGPQTYLKKVVQDYILRGAAGRPYDVDCMISFLLHRLALWQREASIEEVESSLPIMFTDLFLFFYFFLGTADILLLESRVLRFL